MDYDYIYAILAVSLSAFHLLKTSKKGMSEIESLGVFFSRLLARRFKHHDPHSSKGIIIQDTYYKANRVNNIA